MSSLRIVLVRPRNAANVRSIQRTLGSFRDAELVVVSDLDHFERLWRSEAAKREVPLAMPAVPARVDTLADAVRDCSLVVGTTMRERSGVPRLSSRELGAWVARRAPQRWALVFGTEANGLQNADLRHCTATCFIPAGSDQPSLNLSQAAVVFAYELSLPVEERVVAPADERSWRRLRVKMRERFGVAAFEREELLAPLLRADLSEAEVELWLRALS